MLCSEKDEVKRKKRTGPRRKSKGQSEWVTKRLQVFRGGGEGHTGENNPSWKQRIEKKESRGVQDSKALRLTVGKVLRRRRTLKSLREGD